MKTTWSAPFSTKVTSDEQPSITGGPVQGSEDFPSSRVCLKNIYFFIFFYLYFYIYLYFLYFLYYIIYLNKTQNLHRLQNVSGLCIFQGTPQNKNSSFLTLADHHKQNKEVAILKDASCSIQWLTEGNGKAANSSITHFKIFHFSMEAPPLT